ncbi:tetronate 4-phosphate decarboxylase [Seminavis robusta]|uniref:Tetronate 4-phosphate decarboxylase n=1 Tax=Seminavis robusta TaxID=568900 RepID=A0A9N8H0M5_9STRA|nr:tetronate 4-phosphate decarboxylase [Seminavis robusta]|eukprot:Sro23_g015920.1 tetronate 4-phosphate decarboxylase (532) ;mRNA; f:108641-110236
MSSSLADMSRGNPFVHPRDEIVRVMTRMYNRRLTTVSGGNVSIKDSDGTIWITPGSTDKGDMKREQVVFRRARSTMWEGDLSPSREWPFHTKVLQARPDCNAVLHAHSQTLVAFSVANQVPDTLVSYQAYHLCGTAALSPYKMPGAPELADVICDKIIDHDCVIMENHGVVVCGASLSECYQKFEALEFCARAIVKATMLGGNRRLLNKLDVQSENALREAELKQWKPSFNNRPPITTKESELRTELVKYTKRAYDQGLIITCIGAFSARVGPTQFLITPQRMDRSTLDLEDIMLVDTKTTPAKVYGKPGLQPSKEWKLHGAIYKSLPELQAISLAMPFHFGAYCMTDLDFPTNVHPETYLVCRDVGRISFQESQNYDNVVRYFQEDGHHALIIDNKGVVVTGQSVHRVYDMLEICESTTNVILDAQSLSGFNLMTNEQIEELDRHYFGIGDDGSSEDEEEKKDVVQKPKLLKRASLARKSSHGIRIDGHSLALSDDEDFELFEKKSGHFLRASLVRKSQSLFQYGNPSFH